MVYLYLINVHLISNLVIPAILEMWILQFVFPETKCNLQIFLDFVNACINYLLLTLCIISFTVVIHKNISVQQNMTDVCKKNNEAKNKCVTHAQRIKQKVSETAEHLLSGARREITTAIWLHFVLAIPRNGHLLDV